MTLDLAINRYLLKLRILPTLKGYNYLRDCIKLLIDSQRFLSFKKEVYPYVARKHNTTSENVERGISNAIESAWLNGDIEVLSQEFGTTILESRGKPTNKEFVCMAVVKISNQLAR